MRHALFISALIFSTCLFAGELKLDPEMTWVKATAKATGHHFEAELENFECHILIDENMSLTGAELICKVADIKTGKEKRDTEMLHWLESELFPQLHFVMTELTQSENGPVMVGDLKLHNQSQHLEIPINLKTEGGKVHIDGHIDIDTTHFGLKIIKKMGFLKVDPILKVDFEVNGVI